MYLQAGEIPKAIHLQKEDLTFLVIGRVWVNYPTSNTPLVSPIGG
jgi:hypothetical protein